MAKHITVEAPEGGYEITIERGLLAHMNDCPKANLSGRTVIVTNPTIQPLYGESLARLLPDATIALMKDGEQYKTLNTVGKLYGELVAAGLDRSGTVLALGGGVVGDTAGFAAATYMRGVRLVQVPTSLLAMVDASVGGKVGVDLPQGKNLVGAFKQPDAVCIDPDVLQTLPEREWNCGLAEAIKHGLLADTVLLGMCARSHEVDIEEFLARAIQVKVDIVERDPYEKGERAFLNLGHTFAHAIEQVSEYRWLHGEAVAVGLVAATRLSYALGLCDESLLNDVEKLLEQVGLPTRIGKLDPKTLYGAMSTDKKWRGGHPRFVLLRGVGKPLIVEDVRRAEVLTVLKELKS
jgi:3-dehydroquinate synthase